MLCEIISETKGTIINLPIQVILMLVVTIISKSIMFDI